jgi:hypothetical protein
VPYAAEGGVFDDGEGGKERSGRESELKRHFCSKCRKLGRGRKRSRLPIRFPLVRGESRQLIRVALVHMGISGQNSQRYIRFVPAFRNFPSVGFRVARTKSNDRLHYAQAFLSLPGT